MKIKAETIRGCKIQWAFVLKGETMVGFNPEKTGFYRIEVETGEFTYLGRNKRDWQADLVDYVANGWVIQLL